MGIGSSVRSANPGGTGNPSACNLAKVAIFPPSVAWSDGDFATCDNGIRVELGGRVVSYERVRCFHLVAVFFLLSNTSVVFGDSAKLEKEAYVSLETDSGFTRSKECCGYPLSAEEGFHLRFYWMAMQERFDIYAEEVEVYTPRGFYLGEFSASFVKALRLEGSGVLSDGRVVNYGGNCRYGEGTCFREVDSDTYPYGQGAGKRPLVPYRSVAVDPRVVPIGEPLYIPELDGLRFPNGMIHDGCVRADDTGGAIRERKLDFFVVSRRNFKEINYALAGMSKISPEIEHPRCQYLRTALKKP